MDNVQANAEAAGRHMAAAQMIRETGATCLRDIAGPTKDLKA